MFAIALSVTMTATPIAQATMVESSQEEAEIAVETSVNENSLLEDSLIFESSEEEQEVEMVSENSRRGANTSRNDGRRVYIYY